MLWFHTPQALRKLWRRERDSNPRLRRWQLLQFSESSLDFCRSRAGLIREEQFTVIAVWPMHANESTHRFAGSGPSRLIRLCTNHGTAIWRAKPYVDKQVLCARVTESEADGWARLNRSLTAHSEFTPRCCGRLISLSNEIDVEGIAAILPSPPSGARSMHAYRTAFMKTGASKSRTHTDCEQCAEGLERPSRSLSVSKLLCQ